MRDDEDDREEGVHTVPTVPPPADESDPYEAKTQVGGLSDEALAMLRQMRDEKLSPVGTREEASVPVFVDDDDPRSEPRPRPAAGVPAEARPRPAAGMPPHARVPTEARAPEAPTPKSPFVLTRALTSVSTSASASDERPVAAVFSLPKAPEAPSEVAPSPPAESEPLSYVPVFGPLTRETVDSARAQPLVRSPPLGVVVLVVLTALALIVVAELGWIPFLHPLGHPPPLPR